MAAMSVVYSQDAQVDFGHGLKKKKTLNLKLVWKFSF